MIDQQINETESKLDDALATLDEAMKMIKAIAVRTTDSEEKEAALKFLKQVKYY